MILELNEKLNLAGIPHVITKNFDGWLIAYPNDENRIGDVTQFTGYGGSQGASQDLGEAYGFDIPDGDVDGYLTLDQAFEYFRRAHEKTL